MKKRRNLGKRSGRTKILYTYVNEENRKYLKKITAKKKGAKRVPLSVFVDALIAGHRARKYVRVAELRK